METVRFTSRSDSDPYRCNKPNDQSGEYYRKAEVDAELERLRADAERVIDAIDAEPELPGDMPPEMAAAVATAMINEDADFFIHALRLAVRMTKEGIRNRVVAARGE